MDPQKRFGPFLLLRVQVVDPQRHRRLLPRAGHGIYARRAGSCPCYHPKCPSDPTLIMSNSTGLKVKLGLTIFAPTDASYRAAMTPQTLGGME